MKRLMILIIIGLFFMSLFSMLGFVSSQPILPQTARDVILRISDNSNAHGEAWTTSNNYPTIIYYSDLFSGVYSGTNPTTMDPRQCIISTPGAKPDNLVLRLSEDTNAHAQIPDYTGTAYTTDICYGNLVCYSTSGTCNPGVEVVSLSSNTNAHIETSSSNNYNLKVCCTTSSNPQIFNAKLRYFDGNEIFEGTYVCPTQQIIASVQTIGLADGEPILFAFYDDDSGSDDLIAGPLTAQVISNKAEIILNLADPIIRAILLNETGGLEGSTLELFFQAGAQSIIGSLVESQEIIYSDDINQCSSSKPQAIITAPVNRGIYYINTNNINLISGCTSSLGPVTNEWTITQNGNPTTLTGQTVPYTFTSAGQANIKLKCTDLNGNYDLAESQILIIASPYALAYINQPSFEAITYTSPPGTGPYFPNEVSFSASDSFAVNTISSTAPCSVECIGGNCPTETENSPAACGLGGGPLIITQTTNSYSSLLFNWTFLDSDWTTDWASFETSNGIYSGAVQYNDMSNTLNDKKMRVNVRHVATGANADFEREFTLGRCLNNGNTYYASKTESYSTNQPNSACKGGDTVNGTADDCCVAGLQCLPDETDPTNPARYSCQIPAGGLILDCNDYTTQSACNGNTNPAIPLASYGQTPNACTTLSCVWSTTSGTCGLNVTTYQTSSSGACSSGPGAVIVDSCSYTTTVGECIAGRKTISYNPIAGGATCNRSPITVPCGSLSFELSFFGIRQFLISILLIGAIYLVLNFRREIKNA